jgi:acetyl esterase/lipase
VERLFLVHALVSFVLAVNVWRPVRWPFALAVPSFFASWLVAELAMHAIAWQLVVAGSFLWFVGLPGPVGTASLALVVVATGLLAVSQSRAHGTSAIVGQALADGFGLSTTLGSCSYWALAMPFPVRRKGVRRTRNVQFAETSGIRLTLDVIHPATMPRHAPCLVYVHGGGWVVGHRRYQGLPMMMALAARGWVCFSIDYRLSPRATFPDHLVDVKRAIAWVREHGAEYGADPSFIALAGNSAGAHLAALAALTPNDAEYQPGFEDADTRVDGCVAFYGVYDFRVDGNDHWRGKGMRWFLERVVMKRKLDEAPAEFEKASPIARIHADAPPFFLVHGTHDTLAPIQESRRFVERFRRIAHAKIGYAEVPLGQHAFEMFPSIRAAHVLDGVVAFVEHLRDSPRALTAPCRP